MAQAPENYCALAYHCFVGDGVDERVHDLSNRLCEHRCSTCEEYAKLLIPLEIVKMINQ